MIKFKFFILVLSGLILGPSVADAFQLRRVTSGHPVRWGAEEISYYVNVSSIPSYLDSQKVVEIIHRSFGSWDGVKSSYLAFRYRGTTTQTSEYDIQSLENRNVVHFATTKWTLDKDVLAITKTTYSPKSGQLLDADIKINAVHFSWSLSDTNVDYDLQNMLTHEIGHMVGLEHSDRPESTMFSNSKPKELDKRSLAQDDVNGLTYLYPSGFPNQTIVPDNEPLSDGPNVLLGRLDDGPAGCSMNNSQSTNGLAGVGLILLLLIGGMMRMRKRDLTIYSGKVVTTLCSLLVAGLILVSTAPARATIVRYSPVADMALRADLIVLGKVIRSTAAWRNKTIVTRSTIEITEHLKFARSKTRTIVVETPGGEIGDTGMHINGAPKFTLGETVLLFLRRHPTSGTLRTIALALGKFTIVQVGDEPFARRNMLGLNVMRSKSDRSKVAPRTAVHLDDLLFTISEVLTPQK